MGTWGGGVIPCSASAGLLQLLQINRYASPPWTMHLGSMQLQASGEQTDTESLNTNSAASFQSHGWLSLVDPKIIKSTVRSPSSKLTGLALQISDMLALTAQCLSGGDTSRGMKGSVSTCETPGAPMITDRCLSTKLTS